MSDQQPTVPFVVPHYAVIPPVASVWVWKMVRDHIDKAADYQRLIGKPSNARQLEHARDQLREAVRLYERDRAALLGTSEGGSAETESAHRPAESGTSPLGGWTASTVATRLGITSSRVRQLTRAGALTARKSGGTWLIDPESLTEYEARRSIA